MDILKFGLGKPEKEQKLTITAIETEDVKMTDQSMKTKIILICQNSDGVKMNLDEGWIRDYKGSIKNQGFWLTVDNNNAINPVSTLGRLLTYTGSSIMQDLIGKKVTAYPKSNGFFAITTTDVELSEF